MGYNRNYEENIINYMFLIYTIKLISRKEICVL